MDTETDGLCLLLLLQFLLWGCDDFQTDDYEEAAYHLCFRDGCNWEGVEMSFQISIWGGGGKIFKASFVLLESQATEFWQTAQEKGGF